MKKLFEQIIKFGLVGGLCFVIDFVISFLGAKLLRELGGVGTDNAALIAACFGFVISVVVNYVLSMKFVFKRKENMDRRKEFIIFLVLSVVGLIINEIIIKTSMMVANNVFTQVYEKYPDIITAAAKIVATAVVMVYNFVTRKKFLENKDND